MSLNNSQPPSSHSSITPNQSQQQQRQSPSTTKFSPPSIPTIEGPSSFSRPVSQQHTPLQTQTAFQTTPGILQQQQQHLFNWLSYATLFNQQQQRNFALVFYEHLNIKHVFKHYT